MSDLTHYSFCQTLVSCMFFDSWLATPVKNDVCHTCKSTFCSCWCLHPVDVMILPFICRRPLLRPSQSLGQTSLFFLQCKREMSSWLHAVYIRLRFFIFLSAVVFVVFILATYNVVTFAPISQACAALISQNLEKAKLFHQQLCQQIHLAYPASHHFQHGRDQHELPGARVFYSFLRFDYISRPLC